MLQRTALTPWHVANVTAITKAAKITAKRKFKNTPLETSGTRNMRFSVRFAHSLHGIIWNLCSILETTYHTRTHMRSYTSSYKNALTPHACAERCIQHRALPSIWHERMTHTSALPNILKCSRTAQLTGQGWLTDFSTNWTQLWLDHGDNSIFVSTDWGCVEENTHQLDCV